MDQRGKYQGFHKVGKSWLPIREFWEVPKPLFVKAVGKVLADIDFSKSRGMI